jgi:hypothetical protein
VVIGGNHHGYGHLLNLIPELANYATLDEAGIHLTLLRPQDQGATALAVLGYLLKHHRLATAMLKAASTCSEEGGAGGASAVTVLEKWLAGTHQAERSLAGSNEAWEAVRACLQVLMVQLRHLEPHLLYLMLHRVVPDVLFNEIEHEEVADDLMLGPGTFAGVAPRERQALAKGKGRPAAPNTVAMPRKVGAPEREVVPCITQHATIKTHAGSPMGGLLASATYAAGRTPKRLGRVAAGS